MSRLACFLVRPPLSSPHPPPTPPSLPRYASVTLLAGRWPLSSPRGGGSSAVRREPTTPVRLASPLATLVPPGRRALRAAYGECDEALRRPATEPGPRRDPPFLVTHFGSLLVPRRFSTRFVGSFLTSFVAHLLYSCLTPRVLRSSLRSSLRCSSFGLTHSSRRACDSCPSSPRTGAGLRAPVPCRRGAFSLRSRTALPLPAFTSPFGRRDRRASGGV